MLKIIDIFMTFNEAYLPQALVTILSIVKNTQEKLFFHILITDIKPFQQEMIRDFLKHYDVRIEFKLVDENIFSSLAIGWFKNYSTYLRWLLPDTFPLVSKAIYVDADIVFNLDVKNLINIPLNGSVLAAVKDQGMVDLQNHYRNLNLSENHIYFNAGMYIVDCDLWREFNVEQKLFEIAQGNKQNICCPSQDPMNIYFSQIGYLLLNENFNYMPHRFETFDGETPSNKIFHFTKDSFYSEETRFSEYFWYYARMTPYYEKLLIKKIPNVNLLKNTDVTMMRNIVNYTKNRFNYYRCKLLENLTFGKLRKHYKDKKKRLKAKIKEVRRFLKGK